MSVRVLVGDCRAMLSTLPDQSVQTCVTSPPYFGLRDYGVAGQIGLEATPDAFVSELVAVFREVRRVLRDDGTLWLNLGDSYAGYWGDKKALAEGRPSAADGRGFSMNARPKFADAFAGGPIKPKDLIGIPWRVAFALQADGWYLRSDIIWAKPNPMPESVTDRPTKAHEYLFLLSKSPTYYYDADAIREEQSGGAGMRGGSAAFGLTPKQAEYSGQIANGGQTGLYRNYPPEFGRNRRTVWTVPTAPYSGAHFATFPPALIEPCILAGSAKQACETCGAPWERVVERAGQMPVEEAPDDQGRMKASGEIATDTARRKQLSGARQAAWKAANPDKHLGFRPTCACETNTGAGRSVVLDPFGGAGTTGLVADRLGRDAILCELNPQYAELARRRITDDAPLFGDVA